MQAFTRTQNTVVLFLKTFFTSIYIHGKTNRTAPGKMNIASCSASSSVSRHTCVRVFFLPHNYNQSDCRQRGDTLQGKNESPLKETGGVMIVADTIFTTSNIALMAEVGAHTRIHTTLVVVFSSKFIWVPKSPFSRTFKHLNWFSRTWKGAVKIHWPSRTVWTLWTSEANIFVPFVPAAFSQPSSHWTASDVMLIH